jgi:hypothetical protein
MKNQVTQTDTAPKISAERKLGGEPNTNRMSRK